MSKYKFNKDQLKFVEDKLGIYGKLRIAVTYMFVSLLLAVLYYVIFSSFIYTGEEELMKKQNNLKKAELKKMEKKMDNLDIVLIDLKRRDREIYKGIFKSEPPDFLLQGYNSKIFEQIDSSDDESLVIFTTHKIDTTLIRSQSVDQSFVDFKKKYKGSEKLKYIPSITPIRSFSLTQTGAGVGRKIHPFYKTPAIHSGIDILAPLGSNVCVTADGIVSEVSKSEKGRGNMVVVSHGEFYKTVYAHMGEVFVRKSQVVKRGSVIGRVGNSGLSFAPHLHYEVHLKGEPVEPVNYFFTDLTPSQTKEVYYTALNTGQSLD